MSTADTGAFSKDDIKGLVNSGRIIPCGDTFSMNHIQNSSIDLTYGGEAYLVKDFLLPSALKKESVSDLINYMGRESIRTGIMIPGNQYLVKASIDVDLPPGVYGFANAKSTSGRNFLLSRVIVDGVGAYDTISNGYGLPITGKVWLLIEPMAYPVILTDKECYAQIRFFDGDTRIKDQHRLNRVLVKNNIILRQDGSPYKQDELSLSHGDGTVLATLYAKAGKIVGFRAKEGVRIPLDLTARGLDPRIYFDPIYAEEDKSDKDGGLIRLPSGRFDLLSTNEMVDIPISMCSELNMLDHRFGLFFSHFAGFFDPGFKGVPTLEVHSVLPTILRHKQVVAGFVMESMRSVTNSYGEGGNYQLQQRTTLPKQFHMPEEWKHQMA